MCALFPPSRHSRSESSQRQQANRQGNLRGAESINESMETTHGTRRRAHGPTCARPHADEERGRAQTSPQRKRRQKRRSRRGQARRGGKERTSQQDGGGPKTAKAQRPHPTPQRAPRSTPPQKPQATAPATKRNTDRGQSDKRREHPNSKQKVTNEGGSREGKGREKAHCQRGRMVLSSCHKRLTGEGAKSPSSPL